MSLQIDSLIGVSILIATTAFLVIAIELKDLVKATIALGIGSALLASMFFLLGAPIAAVFELSVATGLVTVLLLSAIGMIEKEGAK
jgi:NADH:ubiquinone oxidoreductase subunit 6 (subunit J)